ncbi:Fruiting body protein SC3 [Trametes pubescens]|uniref:Hydrophobin n=1 Tax=Trametes pubescens TaxID=154538 RepID=A0A1M2W6K6_TRAPU|nr:Fruiting body protein SC3 [Trametes pubescens]
MFAKLTSAFAAFAILATATAMPQAAGSCSTGTLQCCNSVEAAGSAAVAPILAALGVVVQDLNIPVGLSCSGVTGVGVGGSDSW